MVLYSNFLRNNPLVKFLLLCSVLFVYFFYINYKYDAITGGISSLLLWSFFVLCTPIADAGFLLDFPIRLIFNIKMFVTEVFVWLIAILINLIIFNYSPEYYNKALITKVFYQILSHPYPYWSIIILSAIGTFLSVHFGDEIIDKVNHKTETFLHKHKSKHQLIAMIILIIFTIFMYYELLDILNINGIN